MMRERIVKYMGVAWDVEFYSDPEEAWVQGIKVNDGAELIDEFTDDFIDGINEALVVDLERMACAKRSRIRGNK